MPVATFCPDKCSTVSYSDSCFGVLEICHVFFKVYHVWIGTGICNTFLAVIVLVWHFRHKQFVIYYIFCDVVCRLFFVLLLLVEFLFVFDCLFLNDCIYFYYLLSCSSYTFLTWFSCVSVSWHVRGFHCTEILVHSHLLCARILLTCTWIYHK